MKTVFSSGDSVQVGLRRSVLEAAHIPCYVGNDYGISHFTHSDSPPAIVPAELCVLRNEDYEDAVRLLAATDPAGESSST